MASLALRLAQGKGVHQPAGQWIRRDLRLAIYLRDGFRCALCGRCLAVAVPREISLDHLRPLARGGTNAPSNLVTVCTSCNAKRGHRKFGQMYERARTRARRSVRVLRGVARQMLESNSWQQAVLHGQEFCYQRRLAVRLRDLLPSDAGLLAVLGRGNHTMMLWDYRIEEE